jgi:hypothetical protein
MSPYDVISTDCVGRLLEASTTSIHFFGCTAVGGYFSLLTFHSVVVSSTIGVEVSEYPSNNEGVGICIDRLDDAQRTDSKLVLSAIARGVNLAETRSQKTFLPLISQVYFHLQSIPLSNQTSEAVRQLLCGYVAGSVAMTVTAPVGWIMPSCTDGKLPATRWTQFAMS